MKTRENTLRAILRDAPEWVPERRDCPVRTGGVSGMSEVVIRECTQEDQPRA